MRQLPLISDIEEYFGNFIEHMPEESLEEHRNSLFFLVLKVLMLWTLSESLRIYPATWQSISNYIHQNDFIESDLNILEQNIDKLLLTMYGIPKNVLDQIHTTVVKGKDKKQQQDQHSLQKNFKMGLINFADKINGANTNPQNKNQRNQKNATVSRDAFGSIYETFILKNKKQHGVYYTPEIITDYICKHTFHEPISDRRFYLDDHRILTSSRRLQESIASIIHYRILDPSCGCGNFLIKMFENVTNHYQKIVEETFQDEDTRRTICSKFINGLIHSIDNYHDPNTLTAIIGLSQLFGFDLDETAISITKINLWLLFLAYINHEDLEMSIQEISNKIFRILNANIRKRDFLIEVCPNLGEIRPFEKFDIIIGNPPYVSSKEIPSAYKDKIKDSGLITAVKQFDLYSVFMEKALHMLKEGGQFGYIIPEAFLARSHFSPIRKLLLNNTTIMSIEQIQNVFLSENESRKVKTLLKEDFQKQTSSKLGVSNIIFLFLKWINPENVFQYTFYNNLSEFESGKGKSIQLSQSSLLNEPECRILFVSDTIQKIIIKIRSDTMPLGDIISIHRGEEIGRDAKFISETKIKNAIPILFGENITQYGIKNNIHYIPKEEVKKTGKLSLYNKPKIMIRQLGSTLNAAIDEKGEYVTSQTVYNIASIREISDNHDNYFLLGLFNSKVIQFYYSAAFIEKKLFPRILIENIRRIPYQKPSEEVNLTIGELVKRMLKKENIEAQYLNLRKQIDDLIFKLYGLDENDEKEINNYLL